MCHRAGVKTNMVENRERERERERIERIERIERERMPDRGACAERQQRK